MVRARARASPSDSCAHVSHAAAHVGAPACQVWYPPMVPLRHSERRRAAFLRTFAARRCVLGARCAVAQVLSLPTRLQAAQMQCAPRYLGHQPCRRARVGSITPRARALFAKCAIFGDCRKSIADGGALTRRTTRRCATCSRWPGTSVRTSPCTSGVTGPATGFVVASFQVLCARKCVLPASAERLKTDPEFHYSCKRHGCAVVCGAGYPAGVI